jgi:glycosyltransferase involved in cell wall biosynthesis
MTMSGGARVTHVITGLGAAGGAENLLFRLLDQLGERRNGHRVITLRSKSPSISLVARIEGLGVPVRDLGMSPRPGPAAAFRLGRALREAPTDVIQTWMLHANVIGGLAGRAVSRTPVAWGVHLSEFDHSSLGTRAAVVQQAERLFSWTGIPTRIVACSNSSQRAMVEMGYRRKRIVTIPNGFDVSLFKPDPAAREEVRRELGLSPATTVVGHVARFHPIKDHATMLSAAKEVLEQQPDVRFVLCGEGQKPEPPALTALTAPLGDRVLVLGERRDVPRLLNAFDLAVSSSVSEALSLAIGEAMASGVPVVATRCGESPDLIGDTGAIVPVRDPQALADSMLRLIGMGPEARSELGRRARARISDHYSLQAMVDQYEALWTEMAGSGRDRG